MIDILSIHRRSTIYLDTDRRIATFSITVLSEVFLSFTSDYRYE